ncbi:hypothetical protein B0H14DRAFT_2596327 [Mycena olivaceomarginata]|nr:hypothetical protein B0H14DRAFT_2596327 [Mycena olivaceomarginata]
MGSGSGKKGKSQCPFPHLKEGKIYTAAMVKPKCEAATAILVPIAIVIPKHLCPHTHPPPPATRVPTDVRLLYERAVPTVNKVEQGLFDLYKADQAKEPRQRYIGSQSTLSRNHNIRGCSPRLCSMAIKLRKETVSSTLLPPSDLTTPLRTMRKPKAWSVRHTDDRIYTSFEFLAQFPDEYRALRNVKSENEHGFAVESARSHWVELTEHYGKAWEALLNGFSRLLLFLAESTQCKNAKAYLNTVQKGRAAIDIVSNHNGNLVRNHLGPARSEELNVLKVSCSWYQSWREVLLIEAWIKHFRPHQSEKMSSTSISHCPPSSRSLPVLQPTTLGQLGDDRISDQLSHQFDLMNLDRLALQQSSIRFRSVASKIRSEFSIKARQATTGFKLLMTKGGIYSSISLHIPRSFGAVVKPPVFQKLGLGLSGVRIP